MEPCGADTRGMNDRGMDGGKQWTVRWQAFHGLCADRGTRNDKRGQQYRPLLETAQHNPKHPEK